MPARAFAVAMTFGAVAACVLDDGYGGASFRCEPADPHCPPGQVCSSAGRCVPDGTPEADAALDLDATPAIDAPPGPPPDANLCLPAAGDACLDAVVLTDGEVAHGSTTGLGNELHPTPTCSGAIENGPDAIFAIDLVAGQRLVAQLDPVDWDAALYVLGACNASSACLKGANTPGNGTELVEYVALASGRYHIIVDASAPVSAGCFTLTVDVQAM